MQYAKFLTYFFLKFFETGTSGQNRINASRHQTG